jgi:ABC-2 type transport system ATP-binding protein
MIQVKNLKKKYSPQVTALDDISFEIQKGEICGYIGTNGAGKTTTVKILIGAMEFDSGEALVDGINVKEKPVDVKKIIGYVPETVNLFNSLTAAEYLDFIGTIHDIEKVTLKRRVDYFAELFGFTGHFTESIGTLSKGNKQKVLITSALFHDPDVVFFDEPLSGLDANSIFIFQDMVSTLASKKKTIFYCSHLLDTIEKISTKIILLENGKIRFDKKTDDLKNSKDFTSLENLFRSMESESEIKKFSYEDIFD